VWCSMVASRLDLNQVTMHGVDFSISLFALFALFVPFNWPEAFYYHIWSFSVAIKPIPNHVSLVIPVLLICQKAGLLIRL